MCTIVQKNTYSKKVISNGDVPNVFTYNIYITMNNQITKVNLLKPLNMTHE